MIIVGPLKPPVSGRVFSIDVDQDRTIEVATTKEAVFIKFINGPGRVTKFCLTREAAIAMIVAMEESMRHEPCTTHQERDHERDDD